MTYFATSGWSLGFSVIRVGGQKVRVGGGGVAVCVRRGATRS